MFFDQLDTLLDDFDGQKQQAACTSSEDDDDDWNFYDDSEFAEDDDADDTDYAQIDSLTKRTCPSTVASNSTTGGALLDSESSSEEEEDDFSDDSSTSFSSSDDDESEFPLPTSDEEAEARAAIIERRVNNNLSLSVSAHGPRHGVGSRRLLHRQSSYRVQRTNSARSYDSDPTAIASPKQQQQENVLQGLGKLTLSPSMQNFLKEHRNCSDFQKMNLMKHSASAESFGFVIETQHKDGPKADPKDNPLDRLMSIRRARGKPCHIQSYKALQEKHLFLEVTKEMIDANDPKLFRAVRAGDLDAIRKQFSTSSLQCCNSFGESILHTTVRRGNYQILDYLVHTANVSLRVVDDRGRTVLHDACWTGKPDFDCIRLLLWYFPEYLLVTDAQNYTPLEYVPTSSWKLWCDFLEEHADLVVGQALGQDDDDGMVSPEERQQMRFL